MAAEDNGFWEKVGVGFLAGAGVALVAEGARALIEDESVRIGQHESC